MLNPISIPNTKADDQAKANPILIRITTKDKIRYINEFIVSD